MLARRCCKYREMAHPDFSSFCLATLGVNIGDAYRCSLPICGAVPLKLDEIRTLLLARWKKRWLQRLTACSTKPELPVHAAARRGQHSCSNACGPRTLVDAGCFCQSPGTSFRSQANRVHLPRRLGALLVAHAAEYVLLIVSWWLIGRAALSGHLDNGWLFAWALILLTLVPFRVLSTWLQGVLAINGGILFKQRLLFGALRLKPEEIRHKGVGQFLGEVMESEAVESLALSVGFQGSHGRHRIDCRRIRSLTRRGPWAGDVSIGSVGRAYAAHGKALFPSTAALDEVEAVDDQRSHRTNGRPSYSPGAGAVPHRHDGEDEELERYLEMSKKMDGAATLLMAVAPRGWLLLGMLGLTLAFVASQGLNITLAISLGGILLAYRALKRLSLGLISLADAVISGNKSLHYFRQRAGHNFRVRQRSPSHRRIEMARAQLRP